MSIGKHMREQAEEVERLRSEVERLKDELARLTPSGQVAEDEALMRRFVADDMPNCAEAHAALSRLAAKAQGYEAAIAAHAAAEKRWETCESERIAAVKERDEAGHIGQQFHSDARKHFDQSCANLQRAEKAEAERDAVVAEKDSLTIAYVDVCVVRDAAVADNAALFALGELLYALAQHDEACKMLVGSEFAMCDCAMGEWQQVQRDVASGNHPGAALLKEKQKQAEVLTMALHVLEAYVEQAVATNVVMLTLDGVGMLQALVDRLRKALK